MGVSATAGMCSPVIPTCTVRWSNSQYYPLAVGYRLANVPENLFNFGRSTNLFIGSRLAAAATMSIAAPASSTVPLESHDRPGQASAGIRRAECDGPLFAE